MLLSRRAREIAIRCVLVLGAVATIATSQAPTNVVADTEDLVLSEVTHVRIVFSAAAVEEAESLSVVFTPPAGSTPIEIIPDDPAKPPFTAQDDVVQIQADPLCSDTGACELGFTLDSNGDVAAMIEVQANAFLSGEEFSDAATVEIIVD